MILSVGGKARSSLTFKAKNIAEHLQIPFVERHDRSIVEMLEIAEDHRLLIVKKERILYYENSVENPVFFHPNSAMFRIKRIRNGEDDPFIRNTQLSEGDSLLDCTLGWASDSIVASFVVKSSGKVIGIEGNETVSFLTSEGLKTFQANDHDVEKAMADVKVWHGNHLDFLKKAKTDSFDVVYFDPMFEEAIDESDGIDALKRLALHTPLSEEAIEEAKRVARRRVVMKDHWKSDRFKQFGFEVERRKTALFHFGVIRCQ